MMGVHLQTWVDGSVAAPALDARAGDALLLRFDYTSGASPFTVLETTLTIP